MTSQVGEQTWREEEGAVRVVALTFEKDRPTKTTWRFAERHADDEVPVVGTIYVKKSALKRLGDPTMLVVILEGSLP